MQSVQVQDEHPTSSFPAAEQSDLAVAGCYRLIEQPADSQVTPENIQAPHRRRTLRRTQGQDAMLRIQDGADLNFAEHPGCAGWGPIGRNKRSQGTPGLPMHTRWRSAGRASRRGGRASGTRRRTGRSTGTGRSRSARHGAAPVGLHLVHLPEESPADAVEALE